MANTLVGRKRIRKFFGKIREVAEMPNLIEVQKASYDQFLMVDEPEGGRADEGAVVGTLIGPAVKYDEVADVIEDIVEAYLALRQRPEELFVDTVKRLGVEPFKERVYATR